MVDSVLEPRYGIDIHDSTTFIFSLGYGGYPVLLLQQEIIKIAGGNLVCIRMSSRRVDRSN